MADNASSILFQAHLAQQHPSNFHNFDILSHVFSCFDPYNKADRVACVNASRVCQAWSVPASVAIWDARPRWDLLDLYHILFSDPPPLNSAGLVDSKKMRDYLTVLLYQGKEPPYDSVAWASFLRCCGRTRELYVPRLEIPEALALGLILKWNEEETLFPSLRSLTWMESPRIRGLLPFLTPPSLRQLKLNFNPCRDVRPAEISCILARLATFSPEIQKMNIVNAHRTGPFPGDSLLRHSSIRKLTLTGSMVLSLQHLREILSLPHLEELSSDLDTNVPENAGAPPIAIRPVVAPNLQKIHCEGTCGALTVLFANLEAPSLRVLEVLADEPGWGHFFNGHRDLVEAIAGAAGNLRFLRYRNFKDSAKLLAERIRQQFVVQDDWIRFAATIRPFWEVFLPLFPVPRPPQPRLRSIERLALDIWSPTRLTPGDFSRAMKAFGGVKMSTMLGGEIASADPDDRRIIYTFDCTFKLRRT